MTQNQELSLFLKYPSPKRFICKELADVGTKLASFIS